MHKLILIKHASPLVDPAKPSDQWKLSEKGRESCDSLARAIEKYAPAVIISSEEPKAQETAELVASKLHIASESAHDLHEHDRSNVPHMRSAEFISMIELMLRRPDEPVLGRETASTALKRFEAAVSSVLKKHSNQSVAIVAHGTVIALFLARHGEGTAFDLWRKLGLPSFAVLNLPEMKIEALVDRVS